MHRHGIQYFQAAFNQIPPSATYLVSRYSSSPYFEPSRPSAEELAKIKQPLRDVGIVADETAAKVGNIGGEAQKAAQAVEAAFAKIGVDVGQVTDGIGQKAR